MATWIFRAGKFVYKHRKRIQRVVGFEKTRRRVIKYRRKHITRSGNEKTKRGKNKSSGTPSMRGSNGTVGKRRKTMRARSAQPVKKTTFYRKGGCPPGYRYDPFRRMCVKL